MSELSDRFLSNVDQVENGCWNWTGRLVSNGYGQFHFNSRAVVAHRWSYEHFVGPIPDGLQLDHLCRNRRCVRPDHLEAVTSAENNRRSDSITARLMRATHCKNGHPLSGENLKIEVGGGRRCRECQRGFRRKCDRRRAAEERARRAIGPCSAVQLTQEDLDGLFADEAPTSPGGKP